MNPVNRVDLWGLESANPESDGNTKSSSGPWLNRDVFDSWNEKEPEAPLNPEESKLQTAIGIAEMTLGGIGGIAAAEATAGTSVLAGMYLMADGANLVGNKLKVQPLAMMTTLMTPYTMAPRGDDEIPFVSPF